MQKNKFMTKGLQRFETRLNYFRQDVELVDLLVINKEKIKGTISIVNKADDGRHPLLNERQNNANSRALITRHLRKTVFVSFFKELHEEVSEYFQYVLRQGSLAGIPGNQLIGEHVFEIKANTLLMIPDRAGIVDYVTQEIYRKLENEKSTSKLLNKMNKKLALNIPKPTIDDASPYMEIRHIFVHRDGRPDDSFIRKYGFIQLDSKGRIDLKITLINDAYEKIHTLLKMFDDTMISKGFIVDTEIIN